MSETVSPGTKYDCLHCGHIKCVSQPPSEAPDDIRTGCAECGTIKRFKRYRWSRDTYRLMKSRGGS